MFKRYLKIWWHLTSASTQLAFQSRLGAIAFFIGKILRFVFFFFVLYIIITKTKSIAGYSFWQVVFFFATFNLVDTLPQFFFRNVYRFRHQVVTGYYDYILTKPMPPLFHPLFGGSDMLDIIIVLASIVFIVYSAIHLQGISALNTALYVLLIMNAFLIALAFHIFVLGIGILTTAVDNTIMLYRDLTQMGRFPINIYQEPLRGLITFVIPIGIMMTFPVQALLGLLSWQIIIIAFAISLLFLFFSLLLWRHALRKYTSASS